MVVRLEHVTSTLIISLLQFLVRHTMALPPGIWRLTLDLRVGLATASSEAWNVTTLNWNNSMHHSFS